MRVESQNNVIYNVFVPLVWKKYFLQHAENCVYTIVFARHWPSHGKYGDLLPEANNIVNTVVLGFRGAKNMNYLRCFSLREFQKKRPKQNLFDDLVTTRLRKKLQG